VTFDLVCLAVLALFALLGLFRGLVRQIFGLLGFVGGLLLARFFAGPLAEGYHGDLRVPVAVAAAIFGLALFLIAEIVAKVAGNLLHGMLGSFTGAVNRVGGLGLGLAKGGLLVWALASLAALAEPHLKSGVASKKAPWIARLDLPGSRAVALAKNTSALGDLAKELREKAEKDFRARFKRPPAKKP